MTLLRIVLLSTALSALAGRDIHAQRRQPRFSASVPVVILPATSGPLGLAPVESSSNRDTATPTYWKEGGVVGGVVLGLVGALLAGSLCNDSDNSEHCGGNAVGGFAIGGLTGFAVGSLIGGQFHKR